MTTACARPAQATAKGIARMINLVLIGIGTGNPDHITIQAQKALNSADLVLIPHKGDDKADLAELRHAICATAIINPATRIIPFDLPVRDAANPSYAKRVDDWHDAIADVWLAAMAPLNVSGTVALLVWGDPSLYDSSLRIADRLRPLIPLHVTVIPGITALQVLTAAHAIPLNRINAPVLITTGRRLRDEGFPQGVTRAAVFLDGECSFQTLDPTGLQIWWGAYLGMQNQILLSGPVAEVTEQIIATRRAARAAHGWIMDLYLLDKQP